MRVRPGELSDFDFLVEMMIEASHWRPGAQKPTPQDALANPQLARYVLGWGRAGDYMSVAEDDEGHPAGASWYRHFTADAPGFGFISEDIPELGIAMRAEHRGKGVGRLLIDDLIAHATATGLEALCLSASSENYAVRLYRACGFETFHFEAPDRLTMTRRLP